MQIGCPWWVAAVLVDGHVGLDTQNESWGVGGGWEAKVGQGRSGAVTKGAEAMLLNSSTRST